MADLKKAFLLFWIFFILFIFSVFCISWLWAAPSVIQIKLAALVLSWICLILGIYCVRLGLFLYRSKQKKEFIFSFISALGCVAVIGFFISMFLSYEVPAWPYRALRTVKKIDFPDTLKRFYPDLIPQLNDWGVADRKRNIAKAPNQKRIVFVGDSFLEGPFVSQPLSLQCEQQLELSKDHSYEVINLGISNTSPIDYYYRTLRVAFKLKPDHLFLFFFSGNDFLSPEERFENVTARLPFVSSPYRDSYAARFFPRLNWYLAQFPKQVSTNRMSPNQEFDYLYALSQGEMEKGLTEISDYMQRVYFPKERKEEIDQVLGGLKEGFWQNLEYRKKDQEFLQGWIINNLLDWELRIKASERKKSDLKEGQLNPYVNASYSWLQAISKECQKRNIPLKIFLIPVGIVDPNSDHIWRKWPSIYSFSLYQDERHDRLFQKLKQNGFDVVDLKQDLKGAAGTYRISDQHWNEKGHKIAADRVVSEISDF